MSESDAAQSVHQLILVHAHSKARIAVGEGGLLLDPSLPSTAKLAV